MGDKVDLAIFYKPYFLKLTFPIYFISFLPTNDEKTPIKHRAVKIRKINFELFINIKIFDSLIFWVPINRCTDSVAIAMLNIIPVVLIVLTVADATP